jgi:GH24 family phage-related lysozyme (muramidase)
MAKVLRQKDGFSNTSPELSDEVKRLQLALKKAGHSVDTDGLFGEGTAKAVKAFQREHGLQDDGVVGSKTWKALEGAGVGKSKEHPAHEKPAGGASLLKGFRGDLSWVHAREGHAGKAYWAGGESGVTLDPGVDLGYADSSLIEAAYKNLLSSEQFSAVKKVLGIKGDAANTALKADPVLQTIRISREQADTIFQFAAKPYWEQIVKRFPTLDDADTLRSVQTALLSISYNRGPNNKGLSVLEEPLSNKNWHQVANKIGSMQQDHRLPGIRKRRTMEAALIQKELA